MMRNNEKRNNDLMKQWNNDEAEGWYFTSLKSCVFSLLRSYKNLGL